MMTTSILRTLLLFVMLMMPLLMLTIKIIAMCSCYRSWRCLC